MIEPNGTAVPGPSSQPNEEPLQTYFDGVGEGIEAVEDAAYEPGTFSPLCEFDATYVLGESQGQAGLGWYNLPADETAAIPFADVHVLLAPDAVVGSPSHLLLRVPVALKTNAAPQTEFASNLAAKA